MPSRANMYTTSNCTCTLHERRVCAHCMSDVHCMCTQRSALWADAVAHVCATFMLRRRTARGDRRTFMLRRRTARGDARCSVQHAETDAAAQAEHCLAAGVTSGSTYHFLRCLDDDARVPGPSKSLPALPRRNADPALLP